MHISIRPELNEIVRNTLESGRWRNELEERGDTCPISYNKPFEMEIFAAADHFRISIDGCHFCKFKYRKPLSNGNYFEIMDGTSCVESVFIENLEGST